MYSCLFNLYIDGLRGEVYKMKKGREVKKTDRNQREWILNQLLFEEDTELVAASAEHLHCSGLEFGTVFKREKLSLNVKKKTQTTIWWSKWKRLHPGLEL